MVCYVVYVSLINVELFGASFVGKLNYLGSSHQWWHLMVVLAFAWTHHMTTLVFLYWKTHHCPTTTQPLLDHRPLDTVALTETGMDPV